MAKVSTNEGSLMKRGGSPSRDVPAVVNGRPPSPKSIEAIYRMGKETISRKEWLHEEHQANQFIEDRHQDNGRGRYKNDCSGWVRGHGSVNGALYPQFDRGKFDKNSVAPKPARGLEANGRDMQSSPLSAARKTYGPAPTFNKDDWG